MAIDMHDLLTAVTLETCRYLKRLLPTLSSNWWSACVEPALTPLQAQYVRRNSISTLEPLDLPAMIRVIEYNWRRIPEKEGLSPEDRTYVKEVVHVRNRWAHLGSEPINPEDAFRDVDTLIRYCRAIRAGRGVIERLHQVRQTLISRIHSSADPVDNVQALRLRIDPCTERRSPQRPPLHEVIVALLREAGGRGLTPSEIRRRIIAQGLYFNRDGGNVSLQQVYARIRNYSHLFALDRSSTPIVIRLANESLEKPTD